MDLNECSTNEDRPSESIGCSMESKRTVICVPGERVCTEGSSVKCAEDGTYWTISEKCEYGCSGGMCNKPPEKQQQTGIDLLGMITQAEPGTMAGIGGGLAILVAAAVLILRRRKSPRIEKDVWGYY